MKEFLIVETYKNAMEHVNEVEDFLNHGYAIVGSGQYQAHEESHPTYYTHIVKETEDEN